MDLAGLPVEIGSGIFRLVIEHSRCFPDVFHDGNKFLDCVSLIDISRVCRSWREIALANATLWAAPYVHLDNPSAETVRQAADFVEQCFNRSEGLPLTFSFIISGPKNFRHAHALQSIKRAVVSRKNRWEQIHLDFEGATIATSRLFYEGLGFLKELHLSGGLEFGPLIKEKNSAAFPIPTLTHLHLVQYHDSPDVISTFLSRAPNLISLELAMTRSWTETDEIKAEQYRFTMPKLQVVDVPINLLPFLTCPTLRKVIFRSFAGDGPADLARFLAFIERSAISLRSIALLDLSIYLMSQLDVLGGYLIPTITDLVLDCRAVVGMSLLSGPLFVMDFNLKHFDVLPELEHLELVGCDMHHAEFVGLFLRRRWNVPNQTLKFVRLTKCFPAEPGSHTLSEYVKAGNNPADLPDEWRDFQACVNEGLLLEIVN